jgi:hypothetical protein
MILFSASDVLRCHACGDRISHAAHGVKLCDGKIVHAVCG